MLLMHDLKSSQDVTMPDAKIEAFYYKTGICSPRYAKANSTACGAVSDEMNANCKLLRASWGGSVAEWLACWTQEQNGPRSNRSRDAVG